MTARKTPQKAAKPALSGSKRHPKPATRPAAATKPALPSPRRFRLTSLESCRREAAAVYRDMRSGTLEPSAGSRLAFVLQVVAKMLETSALEAQIKILEGRTNELESRQTQRFGRAA